MIYFISDLHFGHTNILRLCNRPFASVDEMDRTLIEHWRSKVTDHDTVYLLGDIVWDKKKLSVYMEQLPGKKTLITGNHDAAWCRKEEYQVYFDLVTPYLEISLDGHPITMCHYPMLEWRSARETVPKKIGYHIHGHIHNRSADEYRYLFREFHALNAGVDINGFTPVSMQELLDNNRSFKLSALHHADDIEYFLNKEQRYSPHWEI